MPGKRRVGCWRRCVWTVATPFAVCMWLRGSFVEARSRAASGCRRRSCVARGRAVITDGGSHRPEAERRKWRWGPIWAMGGVGRRGSSTMIVAWSSPGNATRCVLSQAPRSPSHFLAPWKSSTSPSLPTSEIDNHHGSTLRSPESLLVRYSALAPASSPTPPGRPQDAHPISSPPPELTARVFAVGNT